MLVVYQVTCARPNSKRWSEIVRIFKRENNAIRWVVAACNRLEANAPEDERFETSWTENNVARVWHLKGPRIEVARVYSIGAYACSDEMGKALLAASATVRSKGHGGGGLKEKDDLWPMSRGARPSLPLA
jgi:hypothetical protein